MPRPYPCHSSAPAASAVVPVGRHAYPLILGEKDGTREHPASDVGACSHRAATEAAEPGEQFAFRSGAVALAEHGRRDPGRQHREANKGASAGDPE